MEPLVSIIIPTTHERKPFNEQILNIVLSQTYKHKDIVWDWEEGAIGAKRNRCCEKARGEIIVTMDSDDYYSPNWVEKSAQALLASGADITGLNPVNFYDLDNHTAYRYTYHAIPGAGMWLAGATLCYKKSFWEQNKFPDMQVAEDVVFASKAKSIYNHGHIEDFLATIHGGNTSKRQVGNAVNWRRLVGEEEKGIKDRWKL